MDNANCPNHDVGVPIRMVREESPKRAKLARITRVYEFGGGLLLSTHHPRPLLRPRRGVTRFLSICGLAFKGEHGFGSVVVGKAVGIYGGNSGRIDLDDTC